MTTPYIGMGGPSKTAVIPAKKKPLSAAKRKRSAIDITAEDLIPRLTPQNVADLVLLSMVRIRLLSNTAWVKVLSGLMKGWWGAMKGVNGWCGGFGWYILEISSFDLLQPKTESNLQVLKVMPLLHFNIIENKPKRKAAIVAHSWRLCSNQKNNS